MQTKKQKKSPMAYIDEMLSFTGNECLYYQTMEAAEWMKYNYADYANTHPVNVNEELRRLSDADFDLCCALMTMLLREDHFDNGSFERRKEKGDVESILLRMKSLLLE